MARVPIVDDEEYIRDLIREVLLAQGHEFELAGADDYALKPLSFPAPIGEVTKAPAASGK